jgi:hypothetical protein
MAVAVAGAAAAELDEFRGRAALLEPWLGAIQLQRQCNVRTQARASPHGGCEGGSSGNSSSRMGRSCRFYHQNWSP